MIPSHTPSEFLVRKLRSLYRLVDDDVEAIRNLPMQITDLRSDQDIVREGDRATRSCFLITGMAYWYKMTGVGRRQILTFQIPGDLPDIQTVHLTVLDSSLATLCPSQVAFIQHEPLRQICREHPNIASAFWRMTLIDAAIFREWVANLGSRQAYSRVSHLLCELFVRLNTVGLVEGMVCELPITQSELGDATGLSTVHVNRTLQSLRNKELISWKGAELTVLNWPGLQEAGDFDPSFLHLTDPNRGP